MRRPAEHRLNAALVAPESGTGAYDAPHRKREIPSQSSLAPSLAPEDQPSLGQGGRDLGEWFALINPAGGLDAQRLAEAAAAVPVSPAAAQIADLVERWVRRVALGGDQRRAAIRLDFGAGRFSGAELVVVADGGHVSVELSLPSAVAAPDLSQRLRSRLERRGFTADIVVR